MTTTQSFNPYHTYTNTHKEEEEGEEEEEEEEYRQLRWLRHVLLARALVWCRSSVVQLCAKIQAPE